MPKGKQARAGEHRIFHLLVFTGFVALPRPRQPYASSALFRAKKASAMQRESVSCSEAMGMSDKRRETEVVSSKIGPL